MLHNVKDLLKTILISFNKNPENYTLIGVLDGLVEWLRKYEQN